MPALLDKADLYDICDFHDTYSLNMYRDLLFHVQEHSFTLPEVEAMLHTLRLRFAGFFADSATLDAYARQHPDDPQKVNLGHWHAFEGKNPSIFKGMHVFWCLRDDT